MAGSTSVQISQDGLNTQSRGNPDTQHRSIKTESSVKTDTEDPEAVKWLDVFLPAVVQIAIFGGSITFTVVISNNKPPTAYKFGDGTVTTFLALAWLFFVLALALASISQMALSANRIQIVDGFSDGRYDELKLELDMKAHGTTKEEERKRRKRRCNILTCIWWRRKFKTAWWSAKMHIVVLWVFVRFPLSLTVQIPVLAAFVFLSLVVVAYSKVVGFFAVGLTGLCTLGAGLAWTVQFFSTAPAQNSNDDLTEIIQNDAENQGIASQRPTGRKCGCCCGQDGILIG